VVEKSEFEADAMARAAMGAVMADILLSIALYGAVALCLAVLTQFNSWLYHIVQRS
jgi:hypothetical protein